MLQRRQNWVWTQSHQQEQNAAVAVVYILLAPRGESLMISVYRQCDYPHHSSAQWKPWETLCCFPEPIHSREYRVRANESELVVGFLHKHTTMMLHI